MDHRLQLFATKDNDYTLYNPELNETYHSRNGAIAESMHVFIKEGLRYYIHQHPNINNINILEIGFGTGLNAMLTCVECLQKNVSTTYHSLETRPLELSVINQLKYEKHFLPEHQSYFEGIHIAPWNLPTSIHPHFELTKIHRSLHEFEAQNEYNIIFFDAFAPEKQPDMWTESAFNIIKTAMKPNALLVTYSAKGEVKRTLRKLGLDVARIPGPPMKRHMLRATKITNGHGAS